MKRILFPLLAIVVIAACKKAEDQKGVEDSIRGTWGRISGVYVHRLQPSGLLDTPVNYLLHLSPCVLDDALEFKDNFSGSTHLGQLQCNASDPESVPFRWETTGNGTGLRIYDVTEYFPYTGGNVNANIIALNKGSMTLRYSIDTFYRLPKTLGGTDTMIVRDTVTFTDVFLKR